MTNYRKIWESVYGPIPYDNSGRRMELHHIDGDRKNSSINNMILLTIQEHYNIHYNRGDWGACQSIANRMSITPKEKSELCSKLASKRIADGTHHFLNPNFIKEDSIRKSLTRKGENHPLFGKKMSEKTTAKMSKSHLKLVEQGIHHLQSEEHKIRMREKANKELINGTHIFLQDSFRKKHLDYLKSDIANKKHPFNRINRTDPNKILIWCGQCQRNIPKPAFNRCHNKTHEPIKER